MDRGHKSNGWMDCELCEGTGYGYGRKCVRCKGTGGKYHGN